MKKSKKATMLTLLATTALVLTSPITSKAALQANGNAPATQLPKNWLYQIRLMEAAGGALGLGDTINSTNMLSTAENSNNLDVHMEKNTEYGAMAILSASSYGNPNKIETGDTTTGNKTGIVININNEWVATGTSSSTVFKAAKSRYYNIYGKTYSAKKGDAITETSGWHSGKNGSWLTNETIAGLVRAYSGSIFSYSGQGQDSASEVACTKRRTSPSRAVVVIGNGF